ncbi:hypothetical protein [Frankia sp. Cj3]|uniref:hypothetical protein n=1 Tax=Frankia sp. Cj3 TaxID=2880976 RepID=UPI001EF47520|nr:hypothetical protein [Frankia sp. Cj3]
MTEPQSAAALPGVDVPTGEAVAVASGDAGRRDDTFAAMVETATESLAAHYAARVGLPDWRTVRRDDLRAQASEALTAAGVPELLAERGQLHRDIKRLLKRPRLAVWHAAQARAAELEADRDEWANRARVYVQEMDQADTRAVNAEDLAEYLRGQLDERTGDALMADQRALEAQSRATAAVAQIRHQVQALIRERENDQGPYAEGWHDALGRVVDATEPADGGGGHV